MAASSSSAKTPAASLRFHVECGSTKPGEAVFVCGSIPELGLWNPQDALPLATTPKVFPTWASEALVLPPGVDKIEFKVVVQKADGTKPDKATWEGGANRALHMPKSNGKQVQVTATCVWGEPEVTYRTRMSSGAILGGGEGLRASETAPEKPAPASTAAAADVDMPRIETGMNFSVADGPADEGGDIVGELKPLASMSRLASRNSALGMFGRVHSSGSMTRRSSRHLCIGTDGMLNTEMSRTPSLMLMEIDQLEEEVKAHTAEVEQLERDKLNAMQRRMPSGSLLESMKTIIDTADKNNTVLLQGFNWESWRSGGGDWYGIVGKKIEQMKHIGVTDVWLPPPSQSVAPQGYLPSQLFNLDESKYGNRASLEGLIKNLHDNGIRAVADIVINHRCGDKQDSQGRWNQFSGGLESRPSFAGVMDWGGWAITLGDKFSDGTGEHHPGQFDGKFDAAPDIDHGNKKVQESISIWLRWLQLQVGFDAWRFDFVKGYASEYVGHYCKKSAPAWAVGELWCDMHYDDNGLCHNQDKHRQDTVNWINGTDKLSTAFDFTTKGVLQEAVRNCQYWRLRDNNGKPPGLIGWMPTHAVTFIDNHDTGSTQRHWPFPDDKVLVGYAYILTHPGIPSIFWDHAFDWGENHRNQIAELLKARRDSGIPVDAPVKIQCAEDDLYLAEIGNPPTLRVALGPRHAGEADGNYWRGGPSGNQYRVWVKKEAPKPASTPAPKPAAAPAPAPAAEAPAAKSGKSGKEGKKKAVVEDKAATAVAFAAIMLDGVQITPEKLKGMGKEELAKVCAKLEPVVKAANELQKTA